MRPHAAGVRRAPGLSLRVDDLPGTRGWELPQDAPRLVRHGRVDNQPLPRSRPPEDACDLLPEVVARHRPLLRFLLYAYAFAAAFGAPAPFSACAWSMRSTTRWL